MAERSVISVVLLAAALWAAGAAEAVMLTDPTGLYSTQIGDRWVYQAHHSTPELMVFYGEGDFELLYFQRLGPVSYPSALGFARRAVELYAGPGGLEQFELVGEYTEVKVAGEGGVACAYSYEDAQGGRVWEFRIFLVLPSGEGFSIAYSDNKPEAASAPPLEDVLMHWRWLF